MKRLFILLVIVVTSCTTVDENESIKKFDTPKKTCKIIKAKDSPIENKFSSGDYIFGNGSVTKSQTVYYFYFEDGSSKEMRREEYFKFDVGEKICY